MRAFALAIAIVVSALTVFQAGGKESAAQSSATSDAAQAVRNALKQYQHALNAFSAGSPDAKRPAMFVASDELSRREADAYILLLDAAHSMGDAMAQRFDEVKKTGGIPKEFESAGDMLIDNADVEIVGDDAVVSTAGGAPQALRREAGVWEFDLTRTQQLIRVYQRKQLGTDAREAEIAAEINQANTYRELASRIQQGKYRTIKDVQAEFALLQPSAKAAPAAEKKVSPNNMVLGQLFWLSKKLEAFATDTGRFPTAEEGLAALVNCPPRLEGKWKGKYIDEVPRDPWGTSFIYRPTTDGKYELYSAGPDGKPNSTDDIKPLPDVPVNPKAGTPTR